jgi:DNA-binding transcriptional MerR regulator
MDNDKIYYTISEVSKICNVKTHILRSWEECIVALKPRKNKFGHRIYTQSDIKKVEIIKKLAYVDKLSLKGINDYFLSQNHDRKKTRAIEMETLWYEIYERSLRLKKIVDKLEGSDMLLSDKPELLSDKPD